MSNKIMLVVRRLFMWVVETAIAAALIGLWLHLYEGASISIEQPFLWHWWNYAFMTVGAFMLGSGYLLTTGVCAVSKLRDQVVWFYPAVSAALFLAHFWFFSGGWTSGSALLVHVVGFVAIFVCAFLGNAVLRNFRLNSV